MLVLKDVRVPLHLSQFSTEGLKFADLWDELAKQRRLLLRMFNQSLASSTMLLIYGDETWTL
uniref:Uncharacterized protein n=1 Tax=Arundo donax TaxID=35708 RepID=A0A0A9HTR8_ARUDO